MFGWLISPDAASLGQFIGGIAAAVTAGIAVLAAVFAYQQLTVTPRSQREVSAREIWKDYLRLCVEYPHLASGDITKETAKSPVEFEQYEWFVAFMLDACESILLFVADEDEWLDAIDGQIGFHKKYVCSSNFRETYLEHYSEQLQKRIKAICERAQV